jgi:hypothetical protein
MTHPTNASQGANFNPKISNSSLKIENIFLIKHIDFIEIVGDENQIIIIGFRQSQIDNNYDI